MKKLIFLLLLVLLLPGCVFTGYGVNYESGVWIKIVSEEPEKKFTLEATLQDSDSDLIKDEIIKILRKMNNETAKD